jgi:hypothetical protein
MCRCCAIIFYYHGAHIGCRADCRRAQGNRRGEEGGGRRWTQEVKGQLVITEFLTVSVVVCDVSYPPTTQ